MCFSNSCLATVWIKVIYYHNYYCAVIMYNTSSVASLLYAQLQAHVMSHEMANIHNCHDILRLRGQQAVHNLAQSLCCCALHLFRQVRSISCYHIVCGVL